MEKLHIEKGFSMNYDHKTRFAGLIWALSLGLLIIRLDQ